MPQEVADLGEGDAALDQAGGVLMTSVMKVEVDPLEGLVTFGGEVPPAAALDPLDLDVVSLQHRVHPSRSEGPHRIADFVAEHSRLGRLLVAGGIQLAATRELPGAAPWELAGGAGTALDRLATLADLPFPAAIEEGDRLAVAGLWNDFFGGWEGFE